jgi:bidirectional [NiFe] hydrogenase diaphorase subunit
MATLEKDLGISMSETTPDRTISLMAARCLGACGIAPAIVVDGAVSGKQTPESALDHVRVLKQR